MSPPLQQFQPMFTLGRVLASGVACPTMGDRAKIEAGIRALQIGQVKAIDADGKEL